MKVGSQAQPRDLANFACGHHDSALRPRPVGIAAERSHRATTSRCPFVAPPVVSRWLALVGGCDSDGRAIFAPLWAIFAR